MHVQILLTQRLDLMVQALLTPETMWPQEAQGSGLQHIVLSWPTARTLLDTAFAVRPPPRHHCAFDQPLAVPPVLGPQHAPSRRLSRPLLAARVQIADAQFMRHGTALCEPGRRRAHGRSPCGHSRAWGCRQSACVSQQFAFTLCQCQR